MIANKTTKEIIDSLIEITETIQKSALIPEIFEYQVISWCLKHNLDFDKTRIKIKENKDVCCLPTRAFDFSYVFPYYRYKMFTVFFNHPLFENSIVIRNYSKCNEIETEIKF